MTDTKQCAHCGATMIRSPRRSVQDFARLQYCSRRCSGFAAGAKTRAIIDKKLGRTKVCAHCGKEFARPRYAGYGEWATRSYCSPSCSAHHRTDRPQVHGEYVNRCDCGAKAEGIVWIIQGTADGKLRAERTEVCADCREMWLQDGATLEKPKLSKAVRLWSETQESSEYHATAHMALWHMTKGARP